MFGTIRSKIGADNYTAVIDTDRACIDRSWVVQMDRSAITITLEAMSFPIAVCVATHNGVVLVNPIGPTITRSRNWRHRRALEQHRMSAIQRIVIVASRHATVVASAQATLLRTCRPRSCDLRADVHSPIHAPPRCSRTG